MPDVVAAHALEADTQRNADFQRLREVVVEDADRLTTSGADDRPVAAQAVSPASAQQDVAKTPAVDPLATYDSALHPPRVPLQHPFTIEGMPISEVTLRPPSFGDVMAVQAGEMAEIEMIARMTGLTLPAFRALRWQDSEMVYFAARQLAPTIVRD